MMKNTEKIVILDFGSQYTQLIARKVRECGVFAEIFPYNISQENLMELNPKGLILSGGPSSVYAEEAPHPNFDVFGLNIPVLGICYGLQLIAYKLGGAVDKAAHREYGRAELVIDIKDELFEGISENSTVWMSHGDSLTKIPAGFEIIAHSGNAPICAIRSLEKNIRGVQFHPEVHHSAEGKKILDNFLRKICGCKESWDAHSFVERAIESIREQVGTSEVICALSGGVDSTVLAVLLHKAIGDKLHCIHIDTGLMRLNESSKLMKLFDENFNMSIELIDGTDTFLGRLDGVSDPEQKRKIIGKSFIDLFDVAAKKFNNAKWLAQGTLYPDVIESVSVKGPSVVIKSHHNVGGLPEKMGLKLLEPFRELFKDEVRAVGRELGVPDWFVNRHPFPGPGLGIRILGEITREKIATLQKADAIYIEEIRNAGLYDQIWQAFAVLLPVKSVGVMGDERTYENTCVLRAVTSVDGMTADWFPMPYDVLAKMSNRIINEVRGINRVVYDITSKPPGTIEWE
ncbi:MAG: glutamine-hydrolyzing GMP synthase [Candidatus Kapabacteria bacterium]|nr:glutamine-hydrolyzing GMP synthase [Ignavibacteriota bacterium]MCW5883849.1 glutamine-hydrolyzing GMP synthase [Candidatus Kapabacteria bacterium]